MTYTWTATPINEGILPVRRQPVKLITWQAAPGLANGRAQARYLEKPDGSHLFTTGGSTVTRKEAAAVGARYGQQRIILSPLLTEGINLPHYAARLAERWGLDEHGWYAACHYDTAHPHVHFIAETEAGGGERLELDDMTMKAWLLHAQAMSTSILGPYHA